MKHSLHPLPEDKNDYRFGAINDEEENIQNLSIKPFVIYNQGNSDACASCSGGGGGSIMNKRNLFYWWLFAMAIQGNIKGWGTNFRKIVKVLKKFGCPTFQDVYKYPYLKKAYERQDWDFLRDIENYPDELFQKAFINKIGSYIWIHSVKELKSAMWKFRDKEQTVMVGVEWKWNLSDYELIEKEGDGYGHALLCTAFEGEKYTLTGSNGKEAGRQGQHLMNGDLLDKYIKRFGAVMTIDIPEERIQFMLKHKVKLNDTRFTELKKVLKNMFYSIIRV